MRITIEKIDFDQLLPELTRILDRWVATENLFRHDGITETPTFTPISIVKTPEWLELVLAISTKSTGRIGLVGYPVGYAPYHPCPTTYGELATDIWVDTIAGDAPITKVDFSTPGSITWALEGMDSVRANSVEDALLLYRQLSEHAPERIWFNREFISSNYKLLGLATKPTF